MGPPFTFRVRNRFTFCGRTLQAGDRVTVYPGAGVFPVLTVPPNYGAVAGALADGQLEPLTRPVSAASFSQAVGLEASLSPGTSRARSYRAWGRRVHRERARLEIVR